MKISTETVKTVSCSVSKALSHPKIEGDPLWNARLDVRFTKQLRAHFGSEIPDRGIAPCVLYHLLGQNGSQQVVSQIQSNHEHTLGSESTSVRPHASPIQLWMSPDNLGHIAYPVQPLPTVLTAMHAEKDQQILQRQAKQSTTSNGQGFKSQV